MSVYLRRGLPRPKRPPFSLSTPVHTGVVSSAGTGTATWVGASTAASVLASAGTGTATFTGAATAASVLAAAGTGTASFTGASTAASVLSAAGTGAASFTGASTAASVLAAAGTGAASWIGAATTAAVLNAAGTSAIDFESPGVTAAVFAASGTGAFTGVGAFTGALIGGGGNWDTSDPLFYDWWRRKHRKPIEEVTVAPELRAALAEVKPLPARALSQKTVDALAGVSSLAELRAFDAKSAERQVLASLVAEFERLAEMAEMEDEDVILLALLH